MLHAVQFTHCESYLYSRTRSQKLEISSVYRVKRSVNMRHHLAVYTSVASKNASMQRVKMRMKTPLFIFHIPSVTKLWHSQRLISLERKMKNVVFESGPICDSSKTHLRFIVTHPVILWDPYCTIHMWFIHDPSVGVCLRWNCDKWVE